MSTLWFVLCSSISMLFLVGEAFAEDDPADVRSTVIRFADLNGDRLLDRLQLDGSGSMTVALNLGGRRFETVEQALPEVIVSDALVEDLTGDGVPDLLLVSPASNVALVGDGSGGFVDRTVELGLVDGGEGLYAEKVDIDADGIGDVLLHNRRGDVIFWGGPGGGYERDPSTPPTNETPSGVIIREAQRRLPIASSSGPVLQEAGQVEDRSATPHPDSPSAPASVSGSAKRTAGRPTHTHGAGQSRAPGSSSSRAAAPTATPSGPPVLSTPLACAQTVHDPTTDNCIGLDTTPTLGKLYPLGPELNIDSLGRVGIGTTTPGERLSVQGVIETTSGGVRFPDGSLQETAALPVAGHFDVRSFGAVGDGVVDDTAAISSAIDAAIANSDAVVFFPVGTYRLTSTLTKTVTDAADSIALVGAGPGMSTLVWTSATGGLDVTLQPEAGPAAQNHSAFIVRDLKLVTRAVAGGTALRIDGQHVAGANFPNVHLDRITCAQDADGNYWSRGIHLVNLTGANITGYQYWGEFFGAAGIGIRLEGTGSGFDMTDVIIENSKFLHFEKAVEVVGEVEGVAIDNAVMVAGLDGIHWNTAGGEPWLSVVGSHISVDRHCIFGRNLLQCVIQGNLLYQRNDLLVPWVGVDLDATSGSANAMFQVSNNTIHAFPDAEAENGIVLDNAQYCQISNNNIHNVDTAVWFRPQVQNSVALDNVLSNVGLVPGILDEGINNVVRSPGSSGTFRGALVSRVSPQSIPSATWTRVQFEAESYDTSGIWTNATPSRVIVPPGVSKVRITAGLTMQMPASLDPLRQATISKNGVLWSDGASASYPGQPAESLSATQGVAGFWTSLSTPVLEVTPGDYFELIVRQEQQSGAAVNVAQNNVKHANATFLSLEVIE